MLRALVNIERKFATPRLRNYGLFHEDTIFTENDHIKTMAVKMLPPDVQRDRERRIIRAQDLNFKHEHLPKELQDYDPFTPYGLEELIQKLRKEKVERIAYK